MVVAVLRRRLRATDVCVNNEAEKCRQRLYIQKLHVYALCPIHKITLLRSANYLPSKDRLGSVCF